MPGFREAVEKECVHLYRLYGRMPSEVWEQTPQDLLMVMFKEEKKPRVLSPQEALKRLNETRSKKGLPPIISKFLKVLQSVPDKGK